MEAGEQVKRLALLLLAIPLSAQTLAAQTPCLNGQGPLQPGQTECYIMDLSIVTAEFKLLVALPPAPPLPPPESKDCSSEPCLISVPQPNWERLLDSESVWLLEIDGERYELTGADVLRMFKERGTVK